MSRPLSAGDFLAALQRAHAQLEARRPHINDLNVFPVPDGDTGTNMSLTLEAALKEVESAYRPDVSLGRLAKACARGSLLGARGNSGVILSQFFQGFAEGLSGLQAATVAQVVKAMERAVNTAYAAVLEPVEGTMLTVGKAAAQAARARLSPSARMRDVWIAACRGAQKALEETPNLLPVLKRAGVVDAGGMGLVAILEGCLRPHRRAGMAAAATVASFGDPSPTASPPEDSPTVSAPAVATASVTTASGRVLSGGRTSAHDPGACDDVRYTYCTEFVLSGRGLSRASLEEKLTALGDSVLVVGDDEVLKIHLHTNRPGKALEIAVDLGDVTAISIDNMREQVRARAAGLSGEKSASAALKKTASTAFVAVAPGDGLAELFRSLGAAAVVPGGQTMNPSTQQLAEAMRSVSADVVFLLPNNGNIVFAARQAAQLVPEKLVYVIPTTTVPQGVAAALAFHPLPPEQATSEDAARLAAAMEEAIGFVRSGEVTVAVRDYEEESLKVRAGSFIGLADGSILAAGEDRDEVTVELIDRLQGATAEMITVYYGADVSAAEAEALADRLRETFAQAEVELYPGDQPHYPYIVSVE